MKRLDVCKCLDHNTLQGLTVELTDNHILCDIHEAAREVTSIRSSKCGICQTLTCSVGSNKVFEYREAFVEVGLHWKVFDDVSKRISHQTTHTRQLRNLFDGTTGSGCRNNRYRVEAVDVLDDLVTNFSGCIGPKLKHTLLSLCRRQHSLAVLLVSLVYITFRLIKDFLTGFWRLHVCHREGNTGTCRPLEADFLEVIEELDRTLSTVAHVDSGNQTCDLLFVHRDVHPKRIWDDLVKDHTTNRGCEQRHAWTLAV